MLGSAKQMSIILKNQGPGQHSRTLCAGCCEQEQAGGPHSRYHCSRGPPWSLGTGSAFLAGPAPHSGPPCVSTPVSSSRCVPLVGTCWSFISECAASRWGGSGDGGARGPHSALRAVLGGPHGEGLSREPPLSHQQAAQARLGCLSTLPEAQRNTHGQASRVLPVGLRAPGHKPGTEWPCVVGPGHGGKRKES